MKFATLFQSNALSTKNMQSVKGGTGNNIPTVVTIEAQIDITTVSSVGTTELLYCDRRRKKVNC
jgi:hypothetical protein